ASLNPLIPSQSLERIHTGGSACCKPCGSERCQRKEDGRRCERDGVQGADLEKNSRAHPPPEAHLAGPPPHQICPPAIQSPDGESQREDAKSGKQRRDRAHEP